MTSALPMRRTTDCATAASFCFWLISKPRLVYHDTIVLSTVFLNFFYFFKFPVFFIGCLRFHSQTSDSHVLYFYMIPTGRGVAESVARYLSLTLHHSLTHNLICQHTSCHRCVQGVDISLHRDRCDEITFFPHQTADTFALIANHQTDRSF